MLGDLLEKGFGKAMDLNCAEKMLYGANWAYDLKIGPEALKLAAGFGGGMGINSVCGTITGAILVLSHLYVKRNSHEGPRIKELEKEFISKFQECYGCIECKRLKEEHVDPSVGCTPIIIKAGFILDEIVKREGIK